MGLRNQLASEPRANLLFQEVVAIETDARRIRPFGLEKLTQLGASVVIRQQMIPGGKLRLPA